MENNVCDSCKAEDYSENLVWITAEDFVPLQGEHIPAELYEQFDALCIDCYLILIVKEDTNE